MPGLTGTNYNAFIPATGSGGTQRQAGRYRGFGAVRPESLQLVPRRKEQNDIPREEIRRVFLKRSHARAAAPWIGAAAGFGVGFAGDGRQEIPRVVSSCALPPNSDRSGFSAQLALDWERWWGISRRGRQKYWCTDPAESCSAVADGELLTQKRRLKCQTSLVCPRQPACALARSLCCYAAGVSPASGG